MVSKNNRQWKQQRDAQRVPHYGLRKLSVGVASVLLSTTLYMGVTAHADTVAETNPQPTTNQPTNTTSTGDATTVLHAQPTADQSANAAANNSALEADANVKSVLADASKQPANVVDTQPVSSVSGAQSTPAVNGTPTNDVSANSTPAMLPKQPANTADTQSTAAANQVSPFMSLAVTSTNNDLTPKRETVDSKWILHYVDQANHQQELKAPTVITMQYERINTPQSDGTTKYGDWSYVPGSFKQTGTLITVKDSDNPVKQDNIDKNGENMDVFAITAMYPTITGHTMHNGINGTRLHDNLRNNGTQADTMSADFYAEYDVADVAVAVKFVDDDDNGKIVSHKDIHGKTGETQKLTDLPEKYELANGQSDTITFSPNMPAETTVHLKHKIETKQLKIDAYLNLLRLIKYNYNVSENKESNYLSWISNDEVNSGEYQGNYQEIGLVTGTVQYDLVSGKVVKVDNGETLKIGKTSLNGSFDNDVANSGSLTGASDVLDHTFTQWMNEELKDNLSYKAYASANLTKTLLANKELLGHDVVGVDILVPFTFENGKQYGADNEIDTSTIDNSSLVKFGDLLKNNDSIQVNDDGSLSTYAFVYMPVVYQPYISKTVTRTINVTSPDKTVKTIKQTAEINQNVGVDRNDSYQEYLHKGDTYVTDNNWSTYEVPTMDGYTASQTQVEAVAVNGDTTDQTVNISYTANKQSVNVNYVDVNDGNKVVHVTTVNGVTDGDATVINELPTGYKLVDGQSVPKTVHFNANNNNDINIKVQHSTVMVTPDSPKTPSDKLPDNPSKSYPSGVAKDDLSKTVTRKVTITTPDGKQTVTNQAVTFTRNATVDEVTGNVTYGSWSENGQHTFTTVDVPTVPGYTATSDVPTLTVTPDSQNTTVIIGYTANKQQININYVDVNDGNKVVHTTTVNGVTDGDATVQNELPAGYKLVDGQSIPKTIHFNAGNNDDINIKVQHATVTVTPNSPKTSSDKLPDNPNKSYPSGVSENDLNKTITRTIKVTTPDGQTKTIAQTVKLTRTATVDEITGEVTYGKWSTGQWGAYNVPAVPGYTASQPSVEITLVNENTKDQTVDVSYTPNKQSTTIKYVDDKGEVVHTTTVNGATDQTVKVSSEVPAGWTITNGQVPSEITFNADGHEPIEVTVAHQHVTVNPDQPQNNGTKLPDNPAKTFNGVEANDLNKIITRTIKVTTPNGQTKTVEQTVHLTRIADVDEVTGEVTYGNWTTGEWSNYDVPTVQGYTASQSEVPTAKVTGDTKDQTVTVAYTADQQKLIVNFIDDTTGQTLKTVNKDGLTNSDSNYNTKSDIQDYVNNHYRLVSDDTNGQNLVFDNDDSKTQTYNVHLAHNTHNINDSNTVTETIHYKLDNGQKAFDDYNAQLSFTRTGYNDEVTGQNHWNDWQATNGQTFNAIQSPSKEGYTPDKTSIEAVNVNPGDKNIDTTVTYNANVQAAQISYIDDTTGRTLKIDNANGKFNQAINFDNNVDNQIKDYEQQGYVLKSNNFSNQTYQADNAKNAFEVHLVHGTKNVQRTHKITETINYQMDDGSKAPAANTQSVDFTQDGVQDLVTKDIDWKATAPQQFKAVDTPTVTGYTPDITNVPATTVNFGDKDINKLVAYKANVQNATINYIDDTTGKTIKTDNANGKFNQPISFDNNVDNQIKAFENQGYVLKSNSFNGQKYQADNNSNVFEVHLVHGTKNVQRTQKITETINYQMDDGSEAPVTNTQSVDFTQDGVQDLVTNNIDWKATEPQQFKAVDMPTLTGYTPDITNIPATTVNFGDKDINKTVTYKANPQSAKITYIDDNTGETLKVDNANGKFNQVIDFANMNSGIKDFENQGYILKSNSFNGQKYQADNANNTFEVHFTHGIKNVQRQNTITETVKYQYDNGTPAHENNVQTLNFIQDGVQDLVTKNIDWKPTDAQEFKQVDTPAMDGYTPDITSIAATKVNFGDSDINKVVTYQANNQTANIHYVDDMTGSFIGNDTANGKFGTVIDFGNVNDKINAFKNLGYQLVSNGFNGQTYQSDNSKNVYYVHFTHGMKNVQRNKQITETIKYQYENGQQAQPDSVQTVTFNENGSQDLVTKKINWFNDAPQQFKAVSTPVITGYTADIDNIPAVVVSYDNDNINKVVTYKANSQTAKINYIDDTTGKVIKTDTANGKFNQAISFSETPTNIINGLIKRGYKLVSNSFNGQTYQNDNSKNEFTVHLAHNTKNVSKQNTVIRTINYLDNSGKAIQAPIIETVTFTQNGITDLVTGNTTWNTPSSQTFETVKSPTIKGFGKPDVEVVKPQTVNFNDENVVVNVHYPKATTPTNVNDNTGEKTNNNTTTPTVDHNKGKLNPITFTTNTHQTTPQAHTANNGGQQSITPQSINKPSEQPTVANNGTKANTLPQTGNSNDNGTAIIGLGVLSGMLGLLGIKGKKKQD